MSLRKRKYDNPHFKRATDKRTVLEDSICSTIRDNGDVTEGYVTERKNPTNALKKNDIRMDNPTWKIEQIKADIGIPFIVVVAINDWNVDWNIFSCDMRMYHETRYFVSTV